MSLLLRSSKFIRCFSTVYRNVSIHSRISPTLAENSAACCAVQVAQANITRFYAMEAYKDRFSVERCLHNLDFEVRQKGRIAGKDIEDVIFAVKSTGELSSSQALLLIRCCGNLVVEEQPLKRTELAAKVMSTLKELEVPLDISHYNALLKVYLENRTQFSPFQFLQELEKNKIIPNRVTYQYLIGSFCINGDIVGATKILELMKENKIPINEIIFNYLIVGHSEANDIESAADIINIMKEKGIEPSAASYAALLGGYAKFGNIDKMREIFSYCDKEEITLLDKDYMDIIFSLASNGHTEYVDEVLDRVKKSAGYNQNIINLTFRLANEGKDDVAVKLIKTMTSGDEYVTSRNGLFLVYFLLRHNQPLQRIINISNKLRNEGINDNAAVIALREMLIRERREDAIQLLKSFKENNMEIRPHYFYPLFCQAKKKEDNGNRLVLETVRLMRILNVPRLARSVKSFILPNYSVSNVKTDFGMLLNAGIHSDILGEALFNEYVIKGDLKACETLATNFYLSWDKRWARWLTEGLVKSGNVEAFSNIVLHLFDSFRLEYRIAGDDDVEVHDVEDNNNTEIESLEGSDSREKEFGEYIIRQIINNPRAQPFLETVVKGFIENGIGIRESSVGPLSSVVDGVISVELLQKLASPDLKPEPVVKRTTFVDNFSAIRVVKPSGDKVVEFSEEDKHFVYLVNSKLLDQAEAQFEKFKADNTANKLRYANMVKLYCLNKDYEKAAKLGDEMQEKFPNEVCNDFLVIYYFEALLNVNRFDDGVAFLKTLKFENVVPEQLYISMITRYLRNNGDMNKAIELMDIGMKKNIVTPRQFHFIITEYLKRKDYASAANIFSEVVEKYKFVSSKPQILKAMVESGNPELLEQVTNTLAKVVGQINSLVDLTIAFAEANKTKQARRLLETPGLKFHGDKIKIICERFAYFRNEAAIECLINATKGMTHIDRNILYECYLEMNLRNDDPTKALNIWTQMQEEDLRPSEEFLLKLSAYLKGKGLPIPFHVKGQERFELDDRGKLRVVDSITKAIEEGDFDKFCSTLEYLVRSKRRIPFLAITKYLRDIIAKGDIDKLNKIRRIIPDMKPYTTWESMSLLAHASIGKRKEYLLNKAEDLIKRKVDKPITRIPFRTLLNLSFEDQDLVRELEEVEETTKEKGAHAYSSVLWAHYVIKNNFEAAENYRPEDVPHLVSYVKNFAFVKRKTDILETLLKLRDEYKEIEPMVGSIYNDILHIHKLNDDLEQMQHWLNKATEEKKDHLISKDLINFIKLKTKPDFMQIKEFKERTPIFISKRNFHETRGFDSFKKTDLNEIEPSQSNRESSFSSQMKNHILQDCCPSVKFLLKDKITTLKNTCYWIMKVNHTEEPKVKPAPKKIEEKKAEIEEYDLVSHFIGFQSSSINTRGEKDWMKFLKDDSGLLFNKDKTPTVPVPKFRPDYKPKLINMPQNPEDVVIMDSIDDGSNEELKPEKEATTPNKDILDDLEEDLELTKKSQSKDI